MSKIVVTMTSWIKRIQFCHQVITGVLNNTILPDTIYLNLSTEEFKHKEQDLPSDLVKLILDNDIVKLNWVDGPNTKSMKKVFPILKYLDDDDLIIDIDDDLIIPNNLIETRVQEFNKHGGRCAISSGTNPKWHLNKSLLGVSSYNVMCPGSIFQKKMLNGWEKVLTQELIRTYNDDMVYTLLILSNGYQIVPSKLISSQSGITEQKLKLIMDSQGVGMRVNQIYKSDVEVINIFEKAFNDVYPYTFIDMVNNIHD